MNRGIIYNIETMTENTLCFHQGTLIFSDVV